MPGPKVSDKKLAKEQDQKKENPVLEKLSEDAKETIYAMLFLAEKKPAE